MGLKDLNGITASVVDERGEISAMYKGQAENDLGIRTDILNNIKKSIGMEMLIRSMAPQVIACDEIGNKEDMEAINYAVCSGVKGIFTAHGNNLEELMQNPELKSLFNRNIVDKVILLDNFNKGKIKEIYNMKN